MPMHPLRKVAFSNERAEISRIRDADFAHETAQMAKLQIMQQAGMSVLSQTGSAQQGVLSLIR